nr:MAG TPA: hypothetical protein [Caudoviricetes sp.]DAP65215.1 MAG TPA: hypothetical protein [Caudoviricetes sp.]
MDRTYLFFISYLGNRQIGKKMKDKIIKGRMKNLNN